MSATNEGYALIIRIQDKIISTDTGFTIQSEFSLSPQNKDTQLLRDTQDLLKETEIAPQNKSAYSKDDKAFFDSLEKDLNRTIQERNNNENIHSEQLLKDNDTKEEEQLGRLKRHKQTNRSSESSPEPR